MKTKKQMTLTLMGISLLMASCSNELARDTNLNVQRGGGNSGAPELKCPVQNNTVARLVPLRNLNLNLTQPVLGGLGYKAIASKATVPVVQELAPAPIHEDLTELQKRVIEFYVSVREQEELHVEALRRIQLGEDLRLISAQEAHGTLMTIRHRLKNEAFVLLQSLTDMGVTVRDFTDMVSSLSSVEIDRGGAVAYPNDLRSLITRGLMECEIYR